MQNSKEILWMKTYAAAAADAAKRLSVSYLLLVRRVLAAAQAAAAAAAVRGIPERFRAGGKVGGNAGDQRRQLAGAPAANGGARAASAGGRRSMPCCEGRSGAAKQLNIHLNVHVIKNNTRE